MINKPIIYFNSLSSLSGNGSIAAYNGNKDIIAMINNDAYFYNNSVSSWEKINEDYVAGNHINISQNKIIEVSGWENKLDTSAYVETSANIINIIKNKVDISAFEIATSSIYETIENKISLEEFENLSSSFITINSPLTEEINLVIDAVTVNSANWNNDLDALYSAGSNIDITNNTISSKDWTPELSAKLDSSAFSNVSGKFVQTLASSANWDNTYSTVNSESANWTKAYDTVTANSANWDEVNEYSAGPNIEIINNTISSKDWTPELSAKLNSTAFTLPASADWTKAYDTVTANSANWNNDLDTLYSAGPNIDITDNIISSKDWTPELNTKLNSSAFSNVSGKFVQTLASSANWDNTYSTVMANSANWNNDLDTLYSAGSNISITNNTISSKDWTPELNTKLNSSAFILPTSANWTKAYDTVTANSASWDEGATYVAGTNINITNNTISSKDWTPELNTKLNSSAFTLPTSSDWTKAYETVTANSANWDEVIDVSNFMTSSTDLSGSYILSSNGQNAVWSQLDENYDLSGFNGIIISANSANKTINVGYNGSGPISEVVYNLSAGQNIGIQSATDGINDYLVISANANSNVSLPESANWNNTYDTVTNNSANWNSVSSVTGNILNLSAGSNIGIQSATDGINDYLVISANAITEIDLPSSANWTKAYDTVTANSANWNSDLDTLYSAGSNINITNNTISSKDWTPELNAKLNSSAFKLPTSANWDNAYETVTANSASWDEVIQYSAGSNINITNNTISSKDWTPELNAKLNSTAFTLPSSSNWTKAYDTVTANSANWENDIDVSNFVTSSTDLSGSYILSSNGSTTTWHELEEEYELSGLNGVFISANSANKSIDISLTECYDISGFNGILVSANSANKTIDITYSGNLDDLTNNTFILQAGQNVVLTSGENGDNKYLTISAAGIESIGTPYELSGGENINITSASIGTNNYLVISAKGGDSLGTPYNLSAGQNIGIQSATDGTNDYLVISANAITEIDLPSSANWNNTYSTVTNNSANWNSVSSITGNILNLSAGSNIGIQSATDGINDYLVISANAITEIDLPSSANWNNTYNTVTTNSANWNSVSSVTSNIMNLSAGQNIGIQSATDGINDYLVISANAITEIDLPESANWNNTYNTVNSESANWNNTYSTVNSESANWNSVSSVTSHIMNLSAGQNIGIQSATDGINDYLVISANSNSNVSLPESANWTKAYDTVTANSANWDEVNEYSAGSNINITNNTISSKDWTPELNTKLNSTAFTLPTSANWNNTYSTVTNNSANWNSVSSVTSNILNLSAGQNIGIQSATVGDDNYLVISAIGGGEGATYVAGPNINITNNTISSKDWTPELNTKLNSTAFSNVSGKFVQTLSTSSNWNNTYSSVTNNSANWNSISSVTSNIMNLSAGQNIGIQSANDGTNDYLIISANSNSNVSLPESANWNNVYNTVTTNSANWNIDLDTLYSAGSNINITNNTISSKDWTPELNAKLNSTAFTLPSSSNWNNTYSTVTNNSADWSGMYSLVAGNSGYWGQGEGTVFELYSSNGTIGVSSTTATGNKIIYDISLEGTTTSRNYFINRQEQTDAVEYLPNTNISLPDLGNGWQIVNGEANYGDIKYTSLSAYSMNGSAYIIPEEVKLASVDIRLDVIIPSGGLSANYQKVEIVIFDDIKNEYIGKYEKWIDISYDRTEQLNFSEIITEPSSVKLYFRSEFACQTYCRTFSLVDLTYKMLLINNNVTGGSVSLPTSANWNNTYSIVTSNSANWNSVSSVTGNIMNLSAGQNIGIQSATDGTNDYLVISANANSNVSLPTSANWNNTYTTVTNNSANWNSVSGLSAKSDSILCQNISYTTTGSNINVTVPNNTYATISGLNVTGTINVIIPATNVINGSELNSCAGRLTFSTNKPSTLNFVDSSITSKLPVIGQLPTTYSGTNYQFTCVAGVVACQEIKTIT